MNLEQQVCSLELAKRLKELGVKQDSLWAWWIATDMDDTPALNRHPENDCPTCGHPKAPYFEWISAFTVAELGEMLPFYLKEDANRGISFTTETDGLWIRRLSVGWQLGYKHRTIFSDTEANARAKMLIYLLENKLITV